MGNDDRCGNDGNGVGKKTEKRGGRECGNDDDGYDDG